MPLTVCTLRRVYPAPSLRGRINRQSLSLRVQCAEPQRTGASTIHAHSPRLKRSSNSHRRVNVLAEYRSVQSVLNTIPSASSEESMQYATYLSVIRPPHRLLLRLKRIHNRHRPENLLPRDPRTVSHVSEHRRVDKVPLHHNQSLRLYYL